MVIRKNAERVRLVAKTSGREVAVDKGENGVVLLVLQLACHNERHLLVVRQHEYHRGQRWAAARDIARAEATTPHLLFEVGTHEAVLGNHRASLLHWAQVVVVGQTAARAKDALEGRH